CRATSRDHRETASQHGPARWLRTLHKRYPCANIQEYRGPTMKTSRFLAAVLTAICAAPAMAQDSITATHVFPASLIYSRSFLEFVKKANAAAGGAFTITVRGGPE